MGVVEEARPDKIALGEIARVDRYVRERAAGRRREEVILAGIDGEVTTEGGGEGVEVGRAVVFACLCCVNS